jgi:hypothetical protein
MVARVVGAAGRAVGTLIVSAVMSGLLRLGGVLHPVFYMTGAM